MLPQDYPSIKPKGRLIAAWPPHSVPKLSAFGRGHGICYGHVSQVNLKESFMSAVSGQVKDVVNKGQDKAADVAAQVSAKASEVVGRVRDASHRAADTVRDQYGHLEDHAKEAYNRARQAGQEWERGIESYVQRQPLVSLLIAVGVGVVLGMFWKRR